jgi:hypothetical protein
MTYLKIDENLFDSLFKTLLLFVESSGGDGSATIFCRYYSIKDVSDYLEYILMDYKGFIKDEREDYILFFRDQECIHIKKYDEYKHDTLNDYIEFDDISIII